MADGIPVQLPARMVGYLLLEATPFEECGARLSNRRKFPQFSDWNCECSHIPVCRRHHCAKQALGWSLAQPAPG